jgi:hypothetical protein
MDARRRDGRCLRLELPDTPFRWPLSLVQDPRRALRDPAGRILKWFGSNTDTEDSVNASTRLEVQLARMQLLDRTTHAIGAHQEAQRVFEVALRSLEDNLGVDFCCLCLYPGRTAAHDRGLCR